MHRFVLDRRIVGRHEVTTETIESDQVRFEIGVFREGSCEFRRIQKSLLDDDESERLGEYQERKGAYVLSGFEEPFPCLFRETFLVWTDQREEDFLNIDPPLKQLYESLESFEVEEIVWSGRLL